MGSKAVAKPQNKKIARRAGGKWAKGQSGNPGGRPKTGEGTITHYMRLFGGMTSSQLREQVKMFDEALRAGEKSPASMNALIAVATGIRLINDPDARLLAVWLDRTEGRLPTVVKTWRDEWVEALKRGEITPELVRSELGDDTLAEELFRAAGVSAVG